MSTDESKVYAMFADQDFAWIYSYEFTEDDSLKLTEEKDGNGNLKQNPFLVT